MMFLKKDSVQFVLWSLLGIGCVILLGASISAQRSATIQDLKVKVDYEDGLFFVRESDVESRLRSWVKDSLSAISFRELPFSEIEKELEKNPFVEKAEVFSGTNDKLLVNIQQRKPILRVINKNGVGFYMDENAQLMPLSANFTARVPVATGNIDFGHNNSDTTNSRQKKALFDLIQYIRAEPFWQAQTEQIYVNKENEIELVPKLEDHVFLIGNVNELESKFKRMNIFYKEVLKNTKSDRFKTINVKFKNQIICSKN